MKKSLHRRTHSRHAFALIITLIMVVLAAILVIALLVNASGDRINADAVSKRFRAEMAAQSGLNAALIALVGTKGPTDFRYITVAGDNGKPTLSPLKLPDATGAVAIDLANQRALYSNSTVPATITLSTATTPKATRQVGYVAVNALDSNGTNQETERYAFYIDEGGSRQNVGVQGGSNRAYARDPSELPLIESMPSASASPTPFTSSQMTDLKTQRPLIFTPQTANSILTSSPVKPLMDDYSFATASAIANLTPEGKPRVNLTKLKEYVDTLSTDQAKGNVRSKVVDRLLNASDEGIEWSVDGKLPGGNLSFLTKLSHYSPTQCRQIIANLLDYIDADLVPTTDDVNNPTYFGVEGKYYQDSKGNWLAKGHPYINFIQTGMILNLGSGSNAGKLNSTEVLGALGIINPWSDSTDPFGVNYSVEFVVAVHGGADGGSDNAGSYFQPAFDDLTGVSPKLPSDKKLPANTGYIFPNDPKTLNYRNSFTVSSPNPVKFTGLNFKVTKCRLKYVSTGGTSYYVQVLDNLNSTPVPGMLADFDTTGKTGSQKFEFTSQANKLDLHLKTDPRLNFLSGSWALLKSADQYPSPPSSNPVLNIYQDASSTDADFSSTIPSPRDVTWYTSAQWTSDFNVKSPPAKDPQTGQFPDPKLVSSAELGYLHTGIPWETLRMYVTDAEAKSPTPKSRDRELLAYVHSGTFTSLDYGSVPLHSPTSGASPTPIQLIGGPLNINASKPATLASLFLGASAVSDSVATSRAQDGNDSDIVGSGKFIDTFAPTIGPSPSLLPGDFLATQAARTVTNAQTKDFDRETLARRTANMIGTQSTRFTVYALGETRDKLGAATQTTSAVNLRAEVELQVDSSGHPAPKVLSMSYYLTN